MDFGGLDDHYFDSLITEGYTGFSPSHSSDTDTLSPSLSPSAVEFTFEGHDFDLSAPWDSFEFPKQENIVKEEAAPVMPSWAGIGAATSLIPPQTSLLQPVAQQPFTPVVPVASVLDSSVLFPKTVPASKKPRTKRRKVDSEKEVAMTPPPSPPQFSLSEARLSLTRDELLAITSAQYESLISQVRSRRDLSQDEKRDIKNNRRLIKNRESAHLSRQRKKDYVQELEKKLADLAQENERLSKTITVIQNENTLLRSENDFYKGRVQAGTIVPSVVQRGANYLAEQLQAQQMQIPQKNVSQNKAGIMLMVLLFSFGIMFGNIGFPGNNQLSLESSVPEVLPRVYQREEFKPVSNSQVDVLLEEDIPATMIKDRLRKKMVVEQPQLSQEVPREGESSVSMESPVLKMNFDPSFFKANTTYLVCNSKLSFIIPPSSFAGIQDDGQSKDLLVVTCEVTDVAMLPMVESTA